MDTMIVVEAVRTGCWNAITGQRLVVTVPECAEELERGDPERPGYVALQAKEIARLSVEPLSPTAPARLRLEYPDADGLDAGERDLLALALERPGNARIVSCDKAAVRAAHALGLLDRVMSLEDLAASVGARPHPAIKVQYTEASLRTWRTKLLLGERL